MLEVINKTLIGFAIYAILVFVYTLISYQANLNIFEMKWDFKKWINGIVRYGLYGIEGVLITMCAYILIVKLPDWGINALNVEQISTNVIWGITASASVAMLSKCIAKWGALLGLTDEMITKLQQSAIDNQQSHTIELNLNELNDLMPNDYGKKHIDFEKEGGVGTYYHVPISSFNAFMNAVLNNGYDIDNFYGYQCWDGVALLWQQLGKALLTGNGLAIGCWDLMREHDKYDQFDLIYNANDLKEGDVVVMRPNHIGFFVGWNGQYMRILGQNQGGVPKHSQGGAGFNIVNINRNAFAGAFRYKAWNIVAPIPAPLPQKTPSETASNAPRSDEVSYTYKEGDTFGQVILDLGLATSHGLWGDDGDVKFYEKQLHAQGILGNIPIGTTIKLTRRQ